MHKMPSEFAQSKKEKEKKFGLQTIPKILLEFSIITFTPKERCPNYIGV